MSAMRVVRDRAERIASLARGRSDERLDATVFVYQDTGRTAAWVISVLACRHIDEHHRSIKSAVAPEGGS